jgi:hypothetical protein
VATPSAARAAVAATSRAARAPAAVIPTAPPFEHISSIGGEISAAVASGTTAYIAEGNALVMLDVSNPAAPLQRSRMPIAGLSRLAIAGHLLYLISSTANQTLLQIADVSSPTAPVVIGRYSPRAVGPMQVVGTRLYIKVYGSGGFEIVDVSDPTHPRHLGEYQPNLDEMYIRGNLVYVLQNGTADLHGFIVLDVSDPAHPTVVTAFAPDDQGIPSDYTSLSVMGNRAYVTAGIGECRLYTYDLSSPAAPALLSSSICDTPYVGMRAASGQLAYRLTPDLQIWDISDPAAPMLLSTTQLPPGHLDAVQVVGTRIYITESVDYSTTFTDSLHILDISDPVHPVWGGSYATRFESADAIAVSPGGAIGYSVGDNLAILDLKNPAEPTLRGSYFGATAPLNIVGTYVYARSYYGPSNTLQVVDVANPDAPALSSTIELTGSIHAITVVNQLVSVDHRC